jgi:formylglycine-generating enzyme required for sulfatase activity
VKISRTLLARTLFVVVTAACVGCTSFAFPGKGKGSAPDALKDRRKMVKIPAGTFRMGSENAQPDEFPVHDVDINGFLLDTTEVTLRDYRACVSAKVCRKPALGNEETDENKPVVGVSWEDANKYCGWVAKRLPTEAEWEYAARAPKNSAFPWDGRFAPTKVNARGTEDGYEKTAPVGSFLDGASGYGVLDMAGNVAEWTADWYESTWYQKSERSNPRGPEGTTGSRSVRGGSWADNDYLVRSTSRGSLDPNVSNDSVGFRCAAEG